MSIDQIKEARNHLPEPTRYDGEWIETCVLIREPISDIPPEGAIVTVDRTPTILFRKVLLKGDGYSFYAWKGPDGNIYP